MKLIDPENGNEVEIGELSNKMGTKRKYTLTDEYLIQKTGVNPGIWLRFTVEVYSHQLPFYLDMLTSIKFNVRTLEE